MPADASSRREIAEKLQPLVVTSPTELKTAHPSHALYPDGFYSLSTPRGTEDGADTSLGGGPWARTNLEAQRMSGTPGWVCSPGEANQTACSPHHPHNTPVPGGAPEQPGDLGSFCPFIVLENGRHGQVRVHQYQRKSLHLGKDL